MFRLERFGLRHRKLLHFVLLASIIVMQIVLLSILYNEIVIDSKLRDIEKSVKLSIQTKYSNNKVWDKFNAEQQDNSNIVLKHNFSNQSIVQTSTFTSVLNKKQNLFNAHRNAEFYQAELLKLNEEIQLLKNNHLMMQSQFKELLIDRNALLEKYNTAINLLENKEQLQIERQQSLGKIMRKGLLALVLALSILLIFFTRITFKYEEHLENTQKMALNNLKFKDRIVGMISHEIRSPLNIVSLYCNAINKRIKDTELRDSIKSIQFTTNSISLITNQVLSFAKSEDKKMKLNKNSFKLERELVQILDGLKNFVENSGNKLKLNLNIPDEATVYSDSVKIHELFYNIVGNANKFTENGEIEVSAFCTDLTPDEYQLEVKVKDNGIGMSEVDVENVFKEFYQGEVSEKVHNLGLGLGLNLCKELVELFKGDIGVKSQINEGTTVTFKVCLKKCKNGSLISLDNGLMGSPFMTA